MTLDKRSFSAVLFICLLVSVVFVGIIPLSNANPDLTTSDTTTTTVTCVTILTTYTTTTTVANTTLTDTLASTITNTTTYTTTVQTITAIVASFAPREEIVTLTYIILIVGIPLVILVATKRRRK